MLLAVNYFSLFPASCLPAPPKLPALIFNLMLDDIRLKFLSFALSIRGYQAFTLLALSAREAMRK
jgi:hypothetical protein